MKNDPLITFIAGFFGGSVVTFGLCLALSPILNRPEPVQPISAQSVCTLEYREVRPAPEALSFTF